jgi:hypothetical protein
LEFPWDLGFGFWDFDKAMADETASAETKTEGKENAIICPLCGAAVVQEKCKLICRSEICRGRVVMNCSEF